MIGFLSPNSINILLKNPILWVLGPLGVMVIVMQDFCAAAIGLAIRWVTAATQLHFPELRFCQRAHTREGWTIADPESGIAANGP